MTGDRASRDAIALPLRLCLLAAIVLLVVGSKRVDVLMQWWFRQSAGFTRGWSMLAAALGVVLVYAGM